MALALAAAVLGLGLLLLSLGAGRSASRQMQAAALSERLGAQALRLALLSPPAVPFLSQGGRAVWVSMLRERADLIRQFPKETYAANPAWSALRAEVTTGGRVDGPTAFAAQDAFHALAETLRRQAWETTDRVTVVVSVGVGVILAGLAVLSALLRGLHAAEDAQRHDRAEQAGLLESTGEGICATDMHGSITFINTRGAQTLGYAPADLLGKNIHAALRPARPDGSLLLPADDGLLQAITDGQERRAEDDCFWRRDGTPLPV